MELSELQGFLEIVKTGSFRRAATNLRIAQPSLSKRIRRLETELGVQLFDRGTRPPRLTEPGQALVSRSETIVRTAGETAEEIMAFASGRRATVTIGAMQYLAHLELPELLGAFRQSNPDIDLRLHAGNTGEVANLLARGRIHLALLHEEGAQLGSRYEVRRLRTERMVVIADVNHPLGDRTTVPWRELRKEHWIAFHSGASIRSALMSATGVVGFTPHVTLETGDLATAVKFVERGLAIAFVPESFARVQGDRVAAVHPEEPTIHQTLALAWDRSRYLSPAAIAFADQACIAFADGGSTPARR
jgi:DNA-binding transcriptional LysR family regulator